MASKEADVKPDTKSDSTIKKTTIPRMTKYEKAKTLGVRALQISAGAPVCIELDGETDPLEIAVKELKAGKLPAKIKRFQPNGTVEEWSLAELKH